MVVIRSDVGADDLEDGSHNLMLSVMMEGTTQNNQGARKLSDFFGNLTSIRGHLIKNADWVDPATPPPHRASLIQDLFRFYSMFGSWLKQGVNFVSKRLSFIKILQDSGP